MLPLHKIGMRPRLGPHPRAGDAPAPCRKTPMLSRLRRFAAMTDFAALNRNRNRQIVLQLIGFGFGLWLWIAMLIGCQEIEQFLPVPVIVRMFE